MILILSFILLPIALAITGSLTFWPVTHGYDFYIPIILWFAGLAGNFILWSFLLIVFGKMTNQKIEHDKPSKWSQFWLIDSLRFLDFFAFIRVKVTGQELIPPKERFLLVSNHRSNFDPMITYHKFGHYQLAYITKPSNFKIPFGHRFIRGLGFMPIERDDPLQSLEVVKKSISKIQNDYTSVAVYPEGTRHHDCVMGEFHEGMFNIALKAGCPIVVMTIVGTEHISNNYPWKMTRVRLDVIKTIPFEEFQFKTAKQISDEVREMMDKHINEIESKNGQKNN